MIIHGDSLIELAKLPENSVDAVVTDPPYGLKFMNKHWDYDVPQVSLWQAIFMVLKPGGHVVSFNSTRTYHRAVVAIEDAGFEIRDQIQWIYGSGFPKSLDVSKAIDKEAGAERTEFTPYVYPDGITRKDHEQREGVSFNVGGKAGTPVSKPVTDDAKLWRGWGTALKPANEPIVLARKPLSESTVAKNVLRWGTGAINVDASRIGAGSEKPVRIATSALPSNGKYGEGLNGSRAVENSTEGRWPANVLFDESAAESLGEPSRFFYVAKASKRERNAGLEGMPLVKAGSMSGGEETRPDRPTNHPMRQNHHPTVKPIKLMEYLIRLITPPGGVILDPFMGSGSTGVAAKNLGFEFIGIEMNEEYVEIARRRIA